MCSEKAVSTLAKTTFAERSNSKQVVTGYYT